MYKGYNDIRVKSKEDMEKLSKTIMKYLLDENDRVNLVKWETLFKN